MRHPGSMGGASWTMEDIPYAALAHERVRDDRRLFYLVTSASFIEITSDLYTQNLVEYFSHDREIAEWLERVWQKEEVQHGAALRRYVETAWPDFDWDAAYRDFLAAYAPLCTVDQLAATRALEMAARCVVETGTATFYRMLSERSREPVLKQLAARISADEVRHYKHFYRWFLRYQAIERPSRAAVLRALWSRAADIEAEDAFCAFKAVFLARSVAGHRVRASFPDAACGSGWHRRHGDHPPVGASLVPARLRLSGLQDLDQVRQPLPQALDALLDLLGRALGIVGGRADADRQIERLVVHFHEQFANYRTGVLGMKRAVPFERAQQLLLDRVVARMAPGAQTRLVQSLGPPVNFTEHWSPIPTANVREPTRPSQPAAVERSRGVQGGLNF